MNIFQTVFEYIDKFPKDEPIFIEDIRDYVIKQCGVEENEKVKKNINVIINRLKNEGFIKAEYKGVYYKPVITIFGEMGLDSTRLRELKYISDRYGNIKGYMVGAKLYNQLGLTTLVPNVTDIVTNECKHHKQYDEKLRTYITKPKIEINNENYKYLQFIDILENKDNINIEVDNANEIFYSIIQECKLDFEKLLKYIRETNSKKVLEKLLVLAR
ncbi:MAG: hypothetical protein IJH20_00145 [Bacilli bacterium]|nr:hypothetical protein [Bacilli bacterium]